MTLGHGTPFPSPKISFLLFSLFLSFVSSDKGEPGGGPNSAPRGDPPSAGERHRKSLILFLRMSICLCRGQNDLRTCVLNIFPSQQSKWHSRYPVRAEDVDLLVRKVEFPAHQDNPLYLLMFPGSKERQWDQTEEEIRWTIDGLLETVYREDETLYKACGEDGLPVGLIGWTTSPGTCAASVNGGSCDQNCSTVKPKARQGSKVMSRSGCSPPSLDVKSWLGISKTLREERQRVLRNCQGNGVCRKPAVNLSVLRSSLHTYVS